MLRVVDLLDKEIQITSKSINMQRIISSLFFCIIICSISQAQKYNGIDAGMSNLYRLSDAKSRSISPENFTGAKGEGGQDQGAEELGHVVNLLVGEVLWNPAPGQPGHVGRWRGLRKHSTVSAPEHNACAGNRLTRPGLNGPLHHRR